MLSKGGPTLKKKKRKRKYIKGEKEDKSGGRLRNEGGCFNVMLSDKSPPPLNLTSPMPSRLKAVRCQFTEGERMRGENPSPFPGIEQTF